MEKPFKNSMAWLALRCSFAPNTNPTPFWCRLSLSFQSPSQFYVISHLLYILSFRLFMSQILLFYVQSSRS